MNKNSGYVGWSMSRRAVEAYDNGLAPLSRIGTGKFIKAAAAIIGPAEWHHTSKHCNRTDFYSIRAIRACAAQLKAAGRTVDDVKALRLERAKRKAGRYRPVASISMILVEIKRGDSEVARGHNAAYWSRYAAQYRQAAHELACRRLGRIAGGDAR